VQYVSKVRFEALAGNMPESIPPKSILENVTFKEGKPSVLESPDEVIFDYKGKRHTASAREFFEVGRCHKAH
jgi:hypothetical protein